MGPSICVYVQVYVCEFVWMCLCVPLRLLSTRYCTSSFIHMANNPEGANSVTSHLYTHTHTSTSTYTQRGTVRLAVRHRHKHKDKHSFMHTQRGNEYRHSSTFPGSVCPLWVCDMEGESVYLCLTSLLTNAFIFSVFCHFHKQTLSQFKQSRNFLCEHFLICCPYSGSTVRFDKTKGLD